ncbi:type IV secretion system protein VirB11 [Moorella thermoacetica]|uniref:Type IV secretion system protein VirB11 n=1 Tax=Neomoorella thermoacetica TaxID=1525 RepID=A0A1J5JTD3_NEOTH|nr:ATPase, T2SS/T4P/T4SS family [Moorella thermoacetica]OIQ08720.1 type IV secretion system protein VirB11 [Moorella thermoacetica]
MFGIVKNDRADKADKKEEYRLGKRTLQEATKFVQDIITNSEVWGEEAFRHKEILEDAQAGLPGAIEKARELIKEILDKYQVEVEGMTREQLAREIFSYAWGLDVLEEAYYDPEVDEIRVNGPSAVFIQKRGKNVKTGIKFKDAEHVKKIIARLLFHDRGVALTASTPIVESIRKDGTRLTATCPPVTREWTMVLRKHDTFQMTPENLIRAGTLNQELLDLLITMVRGRANILISGGVGSGKTSLMRFLISYIHEILRIVTLETDVELRLCEHYCGRDIIELEEHADLNCDMKKLFRTTLRYSPDIIMVGEIRGMGEAVEAIKACTRGLHGSMATIHFGSPYEAVTGCAKMMLEEGLNLPLEIAETWVADAFDVIIQMFADSTRGIKKIVQVTEVWPEKRGVNFHDLVVWRPSKYDYFEGEWEFVNPPSERLQEKLFKYGVNMPRFSSKAGAA